MFPVRQGLPYLYVDRYLTEAELQEVARLPQRSAVQVDRIIELADEDGACDEEIRSVAYATFGAGGDILRRR